MYVLVDASARGRPYAAPAGVLHGAQGVVYLT